MNRNGFQKIIEELEKKEKLERLLEDKELDKIEEKSVDELTEKDIKKLKRFGKRGISILRKIKNKEFVSLKNAQILKAINATKHTHMPRSEKEIEDNS